MRSKQTQITYEVPPPIGGVNYRETPRQMAESDAQRIYNFFCRSSDLSVRPGYRSHSSGMVDSIQTVAGLTTLAGVRHLLCSANGSLYNATTLSGTASSLGSGFTSELWESENFMGRLFLVNGVDAPQGWTGTALSSTAWTGPSAIANLVDVTAFKSRLWFVEEDTGSLWYGGIRGITGALTEFPIGGLIKGNAYAVETISRQTGAGDKSQIVMFSDTGDVLVYDGDPDNGMVLVSRATIPRLMSRRSVCVFGQDLLLLTRTGVYSLSSALSTPTPREVTDKINEQLIRDVALYGGNAGWQVLFYADGRQVIVNVPLSATTAKQYVLNVETGAYSEYRNLNATAWGMFNSKPYFGKSTGIVYEYDYGTNDDGQPISWSFKSAPLFFGEELRSLTKKVSRIKPTAEFTADTTVNFSLFNPTDRDGSSTSINIDIETTAWGSAWGSLWSTESVTLDQWEVLQQRGESITLEVSGSTSNGTMSYTGTKFLLESGNVL